MLLSKFFKEERYRALIYKMLGALIAFFVQFIVIKLYGAQAFGEYSYFMNVTYGVAIIALFGMTDTTIRYISRSLSREDDERYTFTKFTVIFLLATSLALSSVTALVVENSNIVIENIWLLLWLAPIWVIFDFNISILRGRGKGVSSVLINQVVRPTLFLILCIVTFFISNGQHSLNLIVYYCISLSLIVIYLLINNRHLYLDFFDSSTSSYSPKEWISYAGSMFGVSLSNEVIRRSDIIILGFYVDFKLVALYAVIQSLSNMIMLPLQSLNSFGAARISYLWEKKEYKDLQLFLDSNSKMVVSVSAFFYVILTMFGAYLLDLYTSGFSEGYIVLIVYASSQIINAASGPVGYVMSMTGNQKIASNIFIVGSIINLVLNFILIPQFQLLGAAIATLISMSFWNISLLYYISNRVGLVTCIFLKGFK